jgi:formyltetrahydrofolate deformylase
MQVLSPEFLRYYKKDIINIHHGLLPSFKGANPYRQAYEAGVKLIGATSHFVTEELDDGPIIEQMVGKLSCCSTILLGVITASHCMLKVF